MSAEEWRVRYLRALCGVQLAYRSVESMPLGSVQQQVARANALMAGMRVMKMGDWRPVFPFVGYR